MKIKPKTDDISNMRMFFGIDTTKKYIGNSNIFETTELIKPTTTNFLLTGTLRMGTLI